MNSEITTTPEHEVRRQGWKSSEFWVAIAAVALPILLPLFDGFIAKLPQSSPMAYLGVGLSAFGYAVSRGLVKQSRNESSAKVEAAKAQSVIIPLEPQQGFIDFDGDGIPDNIGDGPQDDEGDDD